VQYGRCRARSLRLQAKSFGVKCQSGRTDEDGGTGGEGSIGSGQHSQLADRSGDLGGPDRLAGLPGWRTVEPAAAAAGQQSLGAVEKAAATHLATHFLHHLMEEGAARRRGMPTISELEEATYHGSEKLRLSLFLNNFTD
jgi:hypothetical protein